MKKYLSGIVAVILAISFSAFTITPKTVSGKLTDYRWAKTNLDETFQLSLFDTQGTLLFKNNVENNKTTKAITLDLSYYSSGVYILKIKSDRGVKTFRLVKL